VASDEWFSAYIAYGSEHALLVPDSMGDYLPSAELTRGELADLIYRFKKEPYTSQVEYGIASYYGYSFDGHNTASGTALNAYGYMAAHKTLPFGTIVRITNLSTNTYVDVEVVDRGPYTEGYVIDLTPTAFEQIGSLSTGILNVRLEVLK
jgi:rare lipoprotein A